jgi:hypothetical protein
MCVGGGALSLGGGAALLTGPLYAGSALDSEVERATSSCCSPVNAAAMSPTVGE